MSYTLCLGVNNIPYDNSNKTTHEVAEYLEDHYGIIQKFYDLNESEISEDLATAMADALEDFANGNSLLPIDLIMNENLGERAEKFRDFLDTGEVERVGIPGTPTKRSLQRISLRFKEKKTKTGEKPIHRTSFLDTQFYRNTFMIWIKE